ncbi:MAG: methionine adenosyltransferase domain-containing protein [Acetobacteraceae bacterium]|nr:methionine adenosyltransferase domain-containing protein [Acetobacteraceae bacterium]
MPSPIVLAHRLARALDAARRDLPWLGPDGKTQAGVVYRGGRPAELATVSLTVATLEGTPPQRAMERALREAVIEPALAEVEPHLDPRTEIHVNAGGPFAIGGPARHAGLTGRKNGIDTYGEAARQSGAALSGKDPSRIDRVAAYAARHAAKCVVAAGLARRCEVHLGYVIGHAQPAQHRGGVFRHRTDRRGGDRPPPARLLSTFRPAAIERRFALRARAHAADEEKGFFRPLAVYGQMGREDLAVPWESVAEAAALR